MQGASNVINHFPRIAFVGKEAITTGSATGLMIARHFSNYPKSKLVDVSWRATGGRALLSRITVESENLRKTFWNSPRRAKLNAYLAGQSEKRYPSLLYKSRVFDPIEIDWDKFGGAPEIIYSTCGSAEDFAFLHHVYRSLPKQIPIVQHFIDVDFSHYNYLLELYFDLLPAMAAVWTDTPAIFYAVNHFSPTKPEQFRSFYFPLPGKYKDTHREFSKNFKAGVFDYKSSQSGEEALQRLWSRCQEKLKFRAPVSPILYGDGSDAYYRRICSLDVGILPLNGRDGMTDQSKQYSLPPALGDLLINGVPVIVIGGRGTAVGKIIEENELGIVVESGDSKLASRVLSHFLFDQEWRADCGEKARYYAEREMDVKLYQKTLYSRLSGFSQQRYPRRSETKKFLGLAFHG